MQDLKKKMAESSQLIHSIILGLSHTLRVHKQYVHTKVRCEVCNEEVCNSFVLKRHKAAVHGLVPTNALKCQLCPMFFHAKKSLQNHMEKKHG